MSDDIVYGEPVITGGACMHKYVRDVDSKDGPGGYDSGGSGVTKLVCTYCGQPKPEPDDDEGEVIVFG